MSLAQRPAVAFLLGAGASWDAGLPLLAELTERVPRGLPGGLRRLYNELRTPDDEWPGDNIPRNVEDILSAADSLAAGRLSWSRYSPRDFTLFAFEVRKQIWRHLSGTFSTRYLDPLEQVGSRLGGLRLLSLNNDLVIESWCRSRGLKLFRGFDSRGVFTPDLFSDHPAEVHLLKLHGSLDWKMERKQELQLLGRPFLSEKGMLPLRSPLPELTVIFPSRIKVVTEPPLLRLTQVFHEYLAQLQTLVVVGCRLGDAHIFEALVAAMLRNEKLRVLLLDPGPAEPLERLRAALKDRATQGRLDVLCTGFGEALQGPLIDQIEGLLRSRFSIGSRLVDLVSNLGDARSLNECRATITEATNCGGFFEAEVLSARTLLAKFLPAGAEGDGVDLVAGLIAVLEAPLHEVSHRLREHLRQLEKEGRLPVCGFNGGLAVAGSDVLLLPKGFPYRLTRLSGGKMRTLGRRLRHSSGLDIVAGRGYCVRPSVLRIEGLGVLQEIDLGSGRRRALRLHRLAQQRPSLALPTPKAILAVLRKVRELGASHLADVKQMLIDFGFLNWSDNVKALDQERLIVLESRRASVVRLPAGRVEASTPNEFVNLADAAPFDAEHIFLLEAGVTHEGSLWLWDLRRGTVSVVVPRIRHGAGLTYDSEARRLLLTVNLPAPNGELWSLPVDRRGAVIGQGKRLMDGLPKPRFVRRQGSEWLLTSGLGLLRIQLP